MLKSRASFLLSDITIQLIETGISTAWQTVFQQESQSATGAFAAELVAYKLRNSTSDIALQQDGQVDVFSHRQILALAERDPFWISPLCSISQDYSPAVTGLRPPSLDIHLLLRMSTEAVAFLRSDVDMLVRIARQYASLRALGIHRWHFEDTTPLPAHLHAVQLEQTRAPHRSNA